MVSNMALIVVFELNWPRELGIFVLYPRFNLVGAVTNTSPGYEEKPLKTGTHFPSFGKASNQTKQVVTWFSMK